jgi:hypothetical protein
MCNQTVSLVAAEIERHGIATVCQIYLREAAVKLRPPRALLVPFAHGYALGAPNDAELQLDVLRQTFALLAAAGPPPVLREYAAQMAGAGAGREV